MVRSLKREFSTFIILLLASGFLSVWLGQDNNWDMRNYHLYNAWGLLNGRLHKDIYTAGIQNYWNPLPDLPYYLIAIEWLPNYPKVVAFLAGMPYGILVFCTWLVSRKVTTYINFDSPLEKNGIAMVATLIGVTGSASISQLGTTFNEIQPGILNIIGLFLLLKNIEDDTPDKKRLYMSLAGAMFGLATGLKLTSFVFTTAAVIALFFIPGNWKQKILSLFVFGIGWVAAFGISYGWWAYKLWRLTENPVFPLFNKIFNSPWVPGESFIDERFKPKSIIETVFYPFFWLTPKPMTVTEVIFADSRFALAYMGVFFLSLSILKQKIKTKINALESSMALSTANSIITLLLVFFVISYVLWQYVFSILRYAVAIEVLCGIIFSLGIYKIASNQKNLLHFVLTVMIGILMVTTIYPEWGRIRYSSKVVDGQFPVLPSNSLVLLLGRPIGYIAPFVKGINDTPEFIGISGDYSWIKGYKLGKLMKTKIREHTGPIFIIYRPEWQDWEFIRSEFNISVNLNSCKKVISNVDEPLKLCVAKRHNE